MDGRHLNGGPDGVKRERLLGVRRMPVDGGREHAMDVQRARVVNVQRARILNAMTHVAAERGAAGVTVTQVVKRAGVSRRTFYELFGDCEECLLAAIDEAVECACQSLLGVCDAGAPWRTRIRAGLVALLRLFDEQPALGRLLVVESLAGGSNALARRARALAPLIAAVEEGRGESKRAAGVPAVAGESVVGGVCSLVYARMVDREDRPGGDRLAGDRAGDGQPLTELTNDLMSMIVLPYLGLAGARRELRAPLPTFAGPSGVESKPLRSDPFKAAGMRLTYRTMRVLGVIASRPQASNRTIGDEAGIGDQGQISKLLARLQRLGLIANGNDGQIKGQANAWTLTSAGRQVASNVQAHAVASAHERTPGGRE